MAAGDFYPTLSHYQVHARASPNAIQQNDRDFENSCLNQTLLDLSAQKLFYEKAADHAYGTLFLHRFWYWIYRFCAREKIWNLHDVS